MHLGDRVCARRPTGVAAQPDHGDMTTANAESGQIRPANKPGRGRLQHTAFVVAMGAQPIGLLEVDARLRWPVARRALVVTHSKGTWCREAPGAWSPALRQLSSAVCQQGLHHEQRDITYSTAKWCFTSKASAQDDRNKAVEQLRRTGTVQPLDGSANLSRVG